MGYGEKRGSEEKMKDQQRETRPWDLKNSTVRKIERDGKYEDPDLRHLKVGNKGS